MTSSTSNSKPIGAQQDDAASTPPLFKAAHTKELRSHRVLLRIYSPMKPVLIFAILVPCVLIAEDSTYQNPVDGKAYRADWKQYDPVNPAEKPSGPVIMNGARLLTDQPTFDKNMSVADLAAFIKATQISIASSVEASIETFAILVDTTISKNTRPQFQMASQGDVSEATLQRIVDGFKSLPDIRSKSDTLKYQVEFEIKK